MRQYTSQGWMDSENRTASLYGVTVSLEHPITGVIGNNDIVQFIADETMDGIDLGWEDAIAEFKAEHGREPDDDETDEMSENYFGCGCETGPHLIGDWKRDDDGMWEPDKTGSAGFSAIVRETTTQVVWSKTTTRAAGCSPCYPGQADIGTDGPFLAYTLPRDCFDDAIFGDVDESREAS